MYNNLVIDAAKTGEVLGATIVKDAQDNIVSVKRFGKYPHIAAMINECCGKKMPYHFQFSLNGRRKWRRNKQKINVMKRGLNVIDRLTALYDTMPKLNINKLDDVPAFHFEPLVSLCGDVVNSIQFTEDIINTFNARDDECLKKQWTQMEDSFQACNQYTIASQQIKNIVIDIGKDYYPEETQQQLFIRAYIAIVNNQYNGQGFNKTGHKKMFWRVFGNLVYNNIINAKQTNLLQYYYDLDNSPCKSNNVVQQYGIAQCIDCGIVFTRKGASQLRCCECQKQYRKSYKKQWLNSSRASCAKK